MNAINEVLSQSIIQRYCDSDVGTIQNIVSQEGGLVHHVFLIQGVTDTVYIKIRKGRFATIPGILINADDIEHEKIGLQIMNRICPGVFPELLHYSNAHHFLIMEDIFKNGGVTLKEYFESNTIEMNVFKNLGYTIGYILNSASKIAESGEPIFPENRYTENLKYRIGVIGNKQAQNLIEELMDDKRQLILGDLAPKNIGVGPDGGIRLFDLDLIALGSKAFDLGYLIGHLILEGHRYGADAVRSILGSFFHGYRIYLNDSAIEDMKTIKVALATIIYRLDNETIPYPIEMGISERNRLLIRAHDLFNSEKVEWHQLIFF